MLRDWASQQSASRITSSSSTICSMALFYGDALNYFREIHSSRQCTDECLFMASSAPGLLRRRLGIGQPILRIVRGARHYRQREAEDGAALGIVAVGQRAAMEFDHGAANIES